MDIIFRVFMVVIFGGLCSLSGIFIIYRAIQECFLAKASNYWRSTRGRVIDSYIDIKYDDGANNYKPIVQYTYKVNEKTFFSQKIFFIGDDISSLGYYNFSKRITEKYSKGRIVKVFYNPKKNKQSVLEPGFSRINIIRFIKLIIFGFIFLSAGVLIIAS